MSKKTSISKTTISKSIKKITISKSSDKKDITKKSIKPKAKTDIKVESKTKKKQKKIIEKNYLNYILHSEKEKCQKTYNGCTPYPERRLRQHNGEIKGGAKRTVLTRPNTFYCIITGFGEDKIKAMQFEWLVAHPNGKRVRPKGFYSIIGRIKCLNLIFDTPQWKKHKLYKISMIINIPETYSKYIDVNNLPDNVSMHIIKNKSTIDIQDIKY